MTETLLKVFASKMPRDEEAREESKYDTVVNECKYERGDVLMLELLSVFIG